MANKIKKVAKIHYYKTLCNVLAPNGKGLNPYADSPLKRKITRIVPGRKKSAVKLLIKGELKGSNYKKWLWRKARLSGLDCLVVKRNVQTIEATIIGSPAKLEELIRTAWAGPKKAKVFKVHEKWFNKPILLCKNSSDSQDVIQWSKETADLYKDILNYIGVTNQEPNEFNVEKVIDNPGEVQRVASNKNLFTIRSYSNVYAVSPNSAIGFQGSQSSKVSTTFRAIDLHKHLAKEVLSNGGLPVPEGEVFTSLDKAKEYLTSCNYPVVVKPVDGLKGRGITVDVRSVDELETAWNYAKKYNNQIILEKLVHGVDVRVLLSGYKVYAVLLRVPANVVGDGQKNIEDLIDEKNQQRLKNPRLSQAPIIPDAYTENFLIKQGYSLESIPPKGEIVFLHLKANISTGADSVTVTEHFHPDLKKLAEEAAKTFEVEDFCGIDLLVQRFDLPRHLQECSIIEVNTRANIYNVKYPLFGNPVDMTEKFISHLFPEQIKDNCYPLVTRKVVLNGLIEADFLDYISEHAKKLEVKGSFKLVDNSVQAIISGRKNKIYSLLDYLWEIKSLNGTLIDGIQVDECNQNVKKSVLVDREDSVNNPANSNGDLSTGDLKLECAPYNNYTNESNHYTDDLNTALFLEEFRKKGYTPQLVYPGLIKINKEQHVGITATRHSSIFCDQVCNGVYFAKKILAINGLPVSRGVKFKTGELENAVEYFNKKNRSLILTDLNPLGVKRNKIEDIKTLQKLWKKARKKGTKHLLLEEYVEGYNLRIAVVAGKAVFAQLVNPISVYGDGKTLLFELIDKKVSLLSQNPAYSTKIDLNKTRKNVANRGYNLDDILPKKERVYLENKHDFDLLGETHNIDEIVDTDFKQKAVEAVAAIPGLQFAVVNMVVPYPNQPANKQKWVINNIDTSPNVDQFHYPLKGEVFNLTKKVISDICLPNAKWLNGKGGVKNENQTS
ncbi:acylphosphatase [Proteinivorax hydrogeniformans]|uniref:Acylphosphatase n=1 Tax=Proteinivorax hydrogeniformans TaxID=1826727 RepID=A0AAU8HWZ9_9FIRM